MALVALAALSGCAAILGADFDRDGREPSNGASNGEDAASASGADGGALTGDASNRDGSRPRDGSATQGSDGEAPDDGGETGGDAAPCARSAGPGDLRLTEIQWQAYEEMKWVELTNVTSCSINVRDVAVVSYRGIDVTPNMFGQDLWLTPGQRAVLSSSPNFPESIPRRYSPPTGAPLGWLFTPFKIQVKRGTTTLIDIPTFPDNFANNVRRSWALPEATCSGVNPLDIRTWPLSTSAFSPNTMDVGQTGTPGAPNTDVSCP